MSESSCVTYFFDLWPSILSTVCMIQVGLSLAVCSITSWSALTILPIIVGAAGAVVNGLSYYLFYKTHPLTPTLVASATADLMWLVQEAGLAFYSYLILIRILRPRSKLIFLILFWIFMASVTIFRVMILVFRLQTWQLADAVAKQALVNQMHLGFFICLAICETLSSFFLLRSFLEARKNAKNFAHRGSIIGQLIRNTEMRVALLALIGIARAITHIFLVEAPEPNGLAAQLDRFVYCLECTFPYFMIFDILASRIANANDNSSRHGPATHNSRHQAHDTQSISLHSTSNQQHHSFAASPDNKRATRISTSTIPATNLGGRDRDSRSRSRASSGARAVVVRYPSSSTVTSSSNMSSVGHGPVPHVAEDEVGFVPRREGMAHIHEQFRPARSRSASSNSALGLAGNGRGSAGFASQRY